MRIERKRDDFQLFSDEVRSAPHTSLDHNEAGCLLSMMRRACDRYDKLSPKDRQEVRIPGILLASDNEYKGKIILRPGGNVQFYWTPFEDSLPPEALKEQTMIFSRLFAAPSRIEKYIQDPLTFGEKMDRLYFYSGIFSFFGAVFSLSMGFSFMAFAMKGVLFLIQLFVAFLSYFLIFAHFQRKHLKEMNKNLSSDIPFMMQPVIRMVSMTDRKILEFFLIMFLVFFCMAVVFSRCIPVILDFWKNHLGTELPF